MPRFLRLAWTFLLAILACAGGAASANSRARESFAPVRAAAAAALRDDQNGFVAGAAMPALIDTWRTTLHHWIEARFDRLGRAASRRLRAVGHRLDRDLSLAAVPLGGSAFLVAAGKSGFGTIFAIRSERGRYRTLWSASGAARGGEEFESLQSWASGASIGLCPAHPHCPPLSADRIGTLPAGSNGRPRFYVQATYRSEIGFTVGGQLSIWEWNGSAARPLLVRNFGYMLAQSAPVLTVNGATLTLGIKGEFTHFYACGQCEGRQMAWRFRARRRGIVDLGQQSLVPEVDLVDRVVDRLLHGENVSSLSDRAPAEFLRREIAMNQEPPAAAGFGGRDYLEMVMAWRVAIAGARHELCLSTLGFAARFTIRGTAGRYRLVAVRPAQGREPCTGARSHM
jgi:hypothetical protein